MLYISPVSGRKRAAVRSDPAARKWCEERRRSQRLSGVIGVQDSKKKRFKVVFALSYEVEAEDSAEAIDEASTQFNDDVETAILKHGEAPSNYFPNNAEEI